MADGGALGCDGAILLQWLHDSRNARMAGVMPGQKTVDSALEVMDVTPWWAEWSVDNTCCRSEGGITMRSLYRITPSTVCKWSRNW